MAPFVYRLIFGTLGVAFAWWELEQTKKEIEERYAAGEEEVTVKEILTEEESLHASASGLAFAAVQLSGGWGKVGAMEAVATGAAMRAVPPLALGGIILKGVPAGLAGIALGAALGIGISKAIWGESGEQTARDVYTGRVSPRDWAQRVGGMVGGFGRSLFA